MLRRGGIWNESFNFADMATRRNVLVLMRCFVFTRHNDNASTCASTRKGTLFILVLVLALVLMLASRSFSRWNKCCYAGECAEACVCVATENQAYYGFATCWKITSKSFQTSYMASDVYRILGNTVSVSRGDTKTTQSTQRKFTMIE